MNRSLAAAVAASLLAAAPAFARVDGKVTRAKVAPAPAAGTAAAAPVVPELVFSLARNGAQQPFFVAGQVIHARMTGLGRDDTYSCVEIASKGDKTCSTPSEFVKMPNADWSYEEGVWRARFQAGNFPADVYRVYFRRGLAGAKFVRSIVIGQHEFKWRITYAAGCGTQAPPFECNAETVGALQMVQCARFHCTSRYLGASGGGGTSGYQWSAGFVIGPCNPGAAPAASCNAGTVGATVPHSCGGQWTCTGPAGGGGTGGGGTGGGGTGGGGTGGGGTGGGGTGGGGAGNYRWSAGFVIGPCDPGAAPGASCNAGTVGATVPHSCGGHWTCVGP